MVYDTQIWTIFCMVKESYKSEYFLVLKIEQDLPSNNGCTDLSQSSLLSPYDSGSVLNFYNEHNFLYNFCGLCTSNKRRKLA